MKCTKCMQENNFDVSRSNERPIFLIKNINTKHSIYNYKGCKCHPQGTTKKLVMVETQGPKPRLINKISDLHTPVKQVSRPQFITTNEGVDKMQRYKSPRFIIKIDPRAPNQVCPPQVLTKQQRISTIINKRKLSQKSTKQRKTNCCPVMRTNQEIMRNKFTTPRPLSKLEIVQQKSFSPITIDLRHTRQPNTLPNLFNTPPITKNIASSPYFCSSAKKEISFVFSSDNHRRVTPSFHSETSFAEPFGPFGHHKKPNYEKPLQKLGNMDEPEEENIDDWSEGSDNLASKINCC